MDEERKKRMQALQMVDLGTARREELSTADGRNAFSNITIQQIEANRMANIDPNVKRLVEKNKELIAAWSTLHERVDGTNIEELNTLMEGQSHRAQLMATLRQPSGVPHGIAVMKQDHSPSSGYSHGQKQPTGRGRYPTEGPKPGYLDPAKEPRAQKEPLSKSSKRCKRFPANPAPSKPSGLKVRRPARPHALQSFSGGLADPAEFIAACRIKSPQLSQPSSTETQPGTSGVAMINQGTGLSTSRWATSDNPNEGLEQNNASDLGLEDRKATAEGFIHNQATIMLEPPVAQLSVPSESVPGKEKQNVKAVSSQETKISSSDQMPLAPNISHSNVPQPHLKPHEQDETNQVAIQGSELLLDFDQTQEVMADSQGSGVPTRVLSSCLHELIDLEFERVEPESPQALITVNKMASSSELSEVVKTRSLTGSSDVVTPTEASHLKLVRYLRELSFLNDALNNGLKDVPTVEVKGLQKRVDFLDKYISQATTMTHKSPPEVVSAPEAIKTVTGQTHNSAQDSAHSRSPSRELLRRAVTVAPFIPRTSSHQYESSDSSTPTTVASEFKSSSPINDLGNRPSFELSLSMEGPVPIDIALDDLCESLTNKLSLNSGTGISRASKSVQGGIENARPGIFSKDQSRTLFASKYAILD